MSTGNGNGPDNGTDWGLSPDDLPKTGEQEGEEEVSTDLENPVSDWDDEDTTPDGGEPVKPANTETPEEEKWGENWKTPGTHQG